MLMLFQEEGLKINHNCVRKCLNVGNLSQVLITVFMQVIIKGFDSSF